MENKSHALAAGLFVSLVAMITLALAAWLTRDAGIRDTYEISTRDVVTGLKEQAPVRLRGVDVGKVSSIGFDPLQQGNVLVRLEIDRGAPITRATYATLGFLGVTGLAFIQLTDDGKPAPRLEADGPVAPRIPLQPGLLAKLESRGEVLLQRVDEAAQRVNQLLGDANQQRFAATLDRLGTAAERAGALALRLEQTTQARLDPMLAEATVTLRNVQKNADEVGRTAADFSATARRLNQPDGPLDRMAEGTEALSRAADSFNNATLPRLNRVSEDTSRAVRALGRAANHINDNPQALIFGAGTVNPGPGEPGFQAPATGGR